MPSLEEKMRKRAELKKKRCQQISVGTRILILGPKCYYPKAQMPMSGRADILYLTQTATEKQEFD